MWFLPGFPDLEPLFNFLETKIKRTCQNPFSIHLLALVFALQCCLFFFFLRPAGNVSSNGDSVQRVPVSIAAWWVHSVTVSVTQHKGAELVALQPRLQNNKPLWLCVNMSGRAEGTVVWWIFSLVRPNTKAAKTSQLRVCVWVCASFTRPGRTKRLF